MTDQEQLRTDQDDDQAESLMPVPIEVEAYVALITSPVRGSLLLGFPFGLAMWGFATIDLLHVPAPLPTWYAFIAGWISFALTIYILISRPY